MFGSPIAQFVLILLAGLILASAVLVVRLRNVFRAALSLGLVLVGVAGLFILLESEFLAFVQILVYVGAILTLVVFAIMLTGKAPTALPPSAPQSWVPAAAVSLALFALLASVVRVLAPSLTLAAAAVTLPQLGRELVTTLALPFEVIGVLFVSVIVGAIAVAASRPPEPRAAKSRAGAA